MSCQSTHFWQSLLISIGNDTRIIPNRSLRNHQKLLSHQTKTPQKLRSAAPRDWDVSARAGAHQGQQGFGHRNFSNISWIPNIYFKHVKTILSWDICLILLSNGSKVQKHLWISDHGASYWCKNHLQRSNANRGSNKEKKTCKPHLRPLVFIDETPSSLSLERSPNERPSMTGPPTPQCSSFFFLDSQPKFWDGGSR